MRKSRQAKNSITRKRGESERDQGISKAGNRRLRAMIVEIAARE